MKYFWLTILILGVVWMFWYGTGGPLMESRKYKFIIPNESGNGFDYTNEVSQ